MDKDELISAVDAIQRGSNGWSVDEQIKILAEAVLELLEKGGG